MASRICAQLAQVVVFVLAARMLTAAEFGTYTLILAIAILLTRIAEAGSREFIMSCREDASLFNQIGTIALASGAVAMVVGLIVSGAINHFFEMKLVADILAIFSVWVVFATFSAVYAGVLVRQSRSEMHSILLMAGEGIGLVITLAGLFAGWGIFALAVGKLVMQITYLFSAMRVTRWIPQPRLQLVIVKELVAFSRYILATRMVAYFHTYAVTFVIGIFFGTASVGYYRVAERLGSSFADMMDEPSRLIAWVSLRRAARDNQSPVDLKRSVGHEATLLLPFLLALAAPIFIGLALVSEQLVVLLLGEQWHPAAPLTALLALMYMLYSPAVLTEPILSLTGQVQRLPLISLCNVAVALAFLLIAVPFDIMGVAIGQVTAATITVCITVWLQSHYGGVDWKQVSANSVIILPALIAMIAGIVWIARFSLPLTWGLALQIFVGAVVYSSVIATLYVFFFKTSNLFAWKRARVPSESNL
ncbi:oligosaccharide flippase family protein [Phyllobacterium sp. YR531]|uniref:oligosaccharide flippase family protein n=1 Tax=Phyllobacterium sp. YR531 TaxID=1144343 RepID=UPI0003159CC2|nr:oligosaccharide flippase family protein [Phyllobacterium sp. YR531]